MDVVSTETCHFDGVNIIFMGLNIFSIVVVITYNFCQLYKLNFYICKSSGISPGLLTIAKSFRSLATVFILSWIIYYFYGIYSIIYPSLLQIENCMICAMIDFVSLTIVISGSFVLTIIGIECSKLMQHLKDDSQHLIISGSPFILFFLKLYAFSTFGTSQLFFWVWLLDSPCDGYPSQQYTSYSTTMTICNCCSSILAMILWFQCHAYTRKLIVFHNSIQRSLENYSLALATRHASEIESFWKKWFLLSRQYWRKYKFWNQNIFIIVTSTITLISVYAHLNDMNDSDDIDATVLFFYIAIPCFAIIFISISSMIMYKWHGGCNRFCLFFISNDNKFRFLCMIKTFLLFAKQLLIYQIESIGWKWALRILSVLSLITLSTITYGFDWNFTKQIGNMKHAKLFYITYGVSYLVTNISTAVVVISSLFPTAGQQYYFMVLLPFLFLVVSKLYNNEYARYMDDVNNRLLKHFDPKQFPTNTISLYYFQTVVVVMSSVTFIILILFHRDSRYYQPDEIEQYNVDVTLQQIFVIIMICNGFCILYILNGQQHETEYIRNGIPMFYEKLEDSHAESIPLHNTRSKSAFESDNN